MRFRQLFLHYRLHFVAGLSDGILTALTLAAGRLTASGSSLAMGLAVRVAVAGAASSAFMLFVAQYSELRGQLAEAERQLNLTSRGQLAASRLGRTVLIESAIAALVGSLAGFCGALLPLATGVLVPSAPWLAIVAALAALGILGFLLAYAVGGQPLLWAALLVVAGGILAYLGSQLRLI